MSDSETDALPIETETRFKEILGGVTGQEIAGLLALVMRKENYLHASTNSGKKVRRWRAFPLGIKIEVTEVNTHGSFAGFQVDYHIETLEWEFRVTVGSQRESFIPGYVAQANHVKFGDLMVKMTYPKFEGDLNEYRHDMTMIRLMGLGSEEQLSGIMMP